MLVDIFKEWHTYTPSSQNISKTADLYILNTGQCTTVKNCIQNHLVCPCPPPPRLDTKFIIRSKYSSNCTIMRLQKKKNCIGQGKKLSLHNNLACKLGRSINEKQTDVPYFFLAWKVLAEKGEGKDRKETARLQVQIFSSDNPPIPQSQQHALVLDRHAFLWLTPSLLNFSSSAASLLSKKFLTAACWVTISSSLHKNKQKNSSSHLNLSLRTSQQCFTLAMPRAASGECSLNKWIQLTIIPKISWENKFFSITTNWTMKPVRHSPLTPLPEIKSLLEKLVSDCQAES